MQLRDCDFPGARGKCFLRARVPRERFRVVHLKNFSFSKGDACFADIAGESIDVIQRNSACAMY